MPAHDDDQPTSLGALSHGQLGYLQIPATDVARAGAFYARVFGWQVEHPHPSFEAPGLIGQWVTGRAPGVDSGLVAWINVDHIDTTLDVVRTSGGDVLGPPEPDGQRWIATIRDPEGNVLGVVQHGPR
ncbi:VOC family protein [Actinopolymorpha sp. B17G11]|uniref:VOC family protein n=1 Tax=unclassified Actinopolymorpha TaxID=2627063 RepID=UPI0032D8F7D6